MTPETAILLVAQQAISNEAQDIEWEDFPYIGENDWLRVQAEIKRMTRPVKQFGTAMNLLEERARGDSE